MKSVIKSYTLPEIEREKEFFRNLNIRVNCFSYFRHVALKVLFTLFKLGGTEYPRSKIKI